MLVELNKPLRIVNLELGDLSVGQVLVRVLVSGICGSQLHEISGNKGNAKFLPHLMGHEGCGIVEEIGPGVKTVKPGDKVVMHWRVGIGIESDFPEYIMNGKKITSGKVNTLAEKVIVSENRLTSVPLETDPEFAALLGCSLSTSLGIFDHQSNLLIGQSVAIIGCGGVGLSLILAAKLRGASKVFVVDKSPAKQDLALLQGATHYVNSIEDVQQKVDLILDTTGNTEIISRLFSNLTDSGQIILVGQPTPGKNLSIPDAVEMFSGEGKQIRATQGGGGVPNRDIPRYLTLFESVEAKIRNLVTHRFNLKDINEAFDVLIQGDAGRIMVKISAEN